MSRVKGKVSSDALRSLLTVKGEGDEWDFKESIDLQTKVARAELARDAMAFGNYRGGGTLVLGVSKAYDLVGIDSATDLDTTRIWKAIERYIDGDFRVLAAAHDVTVEGDTTAKRFGLIYCWRNSVHPLLAACDSPPAPRGDLLFRPGDIFVRRGAQSVRANTGDVRRLLASTAYSKEQVAAAKKVWQATAELRKHVSAVQHFYDLLQVSEYQLVFTNPNLRSLLTTLPTPVALTALLSTLSEEVNLARPYISNELYGYYGVYSAVVGRIGLHSSENASNGKLVTWDSSLDGTPDNYILEILSTVLPDEEITSVRTIHANYRPLRPILDALEALILNEIRDVLGQLPT